jgi:hypothetical protein
MHVSWLTTRKGGELTDTPQFLYARDLGNYCCFIIITIPESQYNYTVL